MGVYATYSKTPERNDPATGLRTWTEYQDWHGWVNSRTVTATPWVEFSRDNCYCCTCDSDDNSGGLIAVDVACRNHGFAAVRPCEKHSMPGSAYDDGTMPKSVQQYREE